MEKVLSLWSLLLVVEQVETLSESLNAPELVEAPILSLLLLST